MNLSKQEFLNTSESAKYIQDKTKLRNKLESDVEEWLKDKSNSIVELNGVGSVPKREHKSKKGQVPESQHRALFKWVDFDSRMTKRRRALSELTGIPIERIRYLFTNPKGKPFVRMNSVEYKLIIEAKAIIERGTNETS